jgi:hypothetical protein
MSFKGPNFKLKCSAVALQTVEFQAGIFSKRSNFQLKCSATAFQATEFQTETFSNCTSSGSNFKLKSSAATPQATAADYQATELRLKPSSANLQMAKLQKEICCGRTSTGRTSRAAELQSDRHAKFFCGRSSSG